MGDAGAGRDGRSASPSSSLVVLWKRYVSLGSIVSAALFPLLAGLGDRLGWTAYGGPWLVLSSAGIGLLIVVSSTGRNLRRLLARDRAAARGAAAAGNRRGDEMTTERRVEDRSGSSARAPSAPRSPSTSPAPAATEVRLWARNPELVERMAARAGRTPTTCRRRAAARPRADRRPGGARRQRVRPRRRRPRTASASAAAVPAARLRRPAAAAGLGHQGDRDRDPGADEPGGLRGGRGGRPRDPLRRPLRPHLRRRAGPQRAERRRSSPPRRRLLATEVRESPGDAPCCVSTPRTTSSGSSSARRPRTSSPSPPAPSPGSAWGRTPWRR